ncbi:MAG TPA: MlaD family protein [Paludibacter sp.]|jgi:phospholipid/cholesterol/gamma-HCH transport system substrate-binding protein|nr:MAG: mce related protein [Bacteroidetes bacterium ADurb.Bin174]HQB28277.1 MlaD family protein [Paludibacter sp.]
MKKIKLSKEVRVGILAVVAIFVLYFGMNFLKGVDIFKPVHYYYTDFSKLDGLVPSSPVFIKGYKVGQVESISYDFLQANSFMVKISVDKNIRIPKNSVIELFDDGLMGGKAIQLLFAAQSTESFHLSGDTLPSQIAVGLFDHLSADLLPKIQDIAIQADSLLLSVRTLVEDESLQNSLKSIERTTADLAESSSSLKKIVQNDIPKVIHNVDVLTNDFMTVSGNLKQIDFAATMDQVDVTIKDLNQITRKINDSEGSLGLLLNDKKLYMNLVNVSNSADELLIDLRQSPKRYVHFSLFGSKAK